jgi:two-component system response regulator AtoC
MMKEIILLIEDDRLMRVTLEDALGAAGYEVLSFERGDDALNSFDEVSPDMVITDVKLPDIDGLQLLRQISGKGSVQIIVMTAFGTIKDAVDAMKAGAFDYITKPFSLDEFLIIVRRALDVKGLTEENIRLKKDINRCYDFPNIIGESAEMKSIFSFIERIARSDSTVLILGESGTGKELIATTIHYQSARKDNPLIKVNCAAIPEGLIESELFGHERGAFTGAIKKKPGRFELASGGTIFLDEIGDLPLSTQSKILRVIQERQFERIGGTETLSVDVRIIAATNKNLEEEVKTGKFREDLYYRLNVIPITLPPLRDRKDDIPYLVDFFVNKYRKKLSKDISFEKKAVDALLGYDYPGNVRELENIVERCFALSVKPLITKDDLPSFISKNVKEGALPPLSDIAAEAEKEYILRILKITKGNKTKASDMLGISRKNLWEKMNMYGIQ